MIVFRPILVVLLALHLFAGGALAQSAPVPPKPSDYVADPTGKLSAGTRQAINAQLQAEERASSNQILVAVLANLPPGEELASYSTRAFNAWGIGQRDKNNGAVLFLYIADRKMFIATSYGLEAVLPDATCKLIIENDIRPQLAAGNIDAGVSAGVNAMLAAVKGEYKGTGRTVNDGISNRKLLAFGGGIFLLVFLVFAVLRAVSPEYTVYSGRGRYSGGWWVSLVFGALWDTLTFALYLALSGIGGGSSGGRGSSSSSSGGSW